ncbi:uncharacterized protein KY384_008950 [Bacidia gigantensis]|uniref:uncharacterized protein n=1 Tax=Bacidia gigantensis TaxID=2732470 RepID=UPI001D058256|nr:uncharacterized protein KY384_008950 [Bacidia gigantensis]KAG8525306.1 hypothetical protein KY384_008950 [Bacidia gigantensis]
MTTGENLAHSDDFISLFVTSDKNYKSTAFVDANPLVSFYTFFISNRTSTPLLYESALQLCVQTYNTTVIDGQTSTNVLATYTNVNATLDYTITVPADSSAYLMSRYSVNTMTDFFRTVLRARYAVKENNPIYGSDAIEVLVDTLLVPPYDMAAMSNFLHGLATSMTNTLEPWKMSTLATLQALSSAMHEDLGPLRKQAEMEEHGDDRMVRLRKGAMGGWRLVAHENK